MSNNFKLSAIVVALATVSGSAIAAPTPVTNLKNDTTYGWYQRLLGQTETVNSSNFDPIAETGRTETNTKTVDNTTPVSQAGTVGTASIVWLDLDGDGTNEAYLQKALADERFAGSTQTTIQNIDNYDIPAGQESSVASKRTLTNNRSDVSGTAVNTGVILQRLQTAVIGGNTVVVDSAGAATTDPAQAVKVGAEFRSDDTNVAFTADDLTKKGGATNVITNRTQTWTDYQATQALANTYEDSQVNVNETNAKKYDTNGKQTVTGGTADFIKTGDHKNNSTTVIKNYRSGQSELANTSDVTTDTSSTSANYFYKQNGAGQWLDADGNVTTDPNKRVFSFVSADGTTVSDVVTTESKTSNSQKWYQADQEKVYEQTRTGSNKTTTTDVFDGFVGTNESTSTLNNVDYGNAKNKLDFDNKSSSTYATKTRALETNPSTGALVLKNGKPVVQSVTETNGNAQTERADYEASEYTSGTAKDTDTVFRTRAVGGAEGTGASTRGNKWRLDQNEAIGWIRDSQAIEHSVNNSVNNLTRTDAVDGFVAHSNTTLVDTAKYARNLQENIEVSRDLVLNSSSDDKEISRDYTFTTTTGEQVVLKDVNLKIDGSAITAADVREWVEVDTEGKETKKYFVVLGQDLDGREIREEVGFVAATANDQKANVIAQNVSTNNNSEKVHPEGGKVFYDKTTAQSWNDTEIVQGAAVGDRVAGTLNEKTTLFTRGNGNELDHQRVVNTTWDNQVAYKRDSANNIILKDGKPVVENVRNNKGTNSTTTNLYQEGQAKTREDIFTSTSDNKVSDAAGNVLSTNIGHNNNTTVNYAKGQELARTIVGDAANEITVKSSVENAGLVGGFLDGRTQGAYNYDGTAKAYIGSNTLHSDGTKDADLEVSNPKEGIVDVGFKNNTTNTLNDKVYQDGGAKALERATVNTNETVLTYADNTTGKIVDNDSLSVTLFNKGKADKYREAVKTTTTEKTGKNYQADEDGDIILANGKPVEQGTSSDKQTVKTTENLYQIGQERKTDTVVVTDTSEKTANVDGSGRDLTAKATNESIEYRAGQKDGKESEVNGTTSSELKVTNTDKTGYTYKVNGKESDVTNATEMYLLATRDVKSVQKSEWTESLAASGKNAVSITRGDEVVNRTDESRTVTGYGSETVTAATGTTTVAKKEVDVTDKFGTFESSTLSRTETKVAADKSSTVNTKTRAESVDGVVLTSTQTNTDAAGKATTTETKTTIDANSVTTNHVVAERITLQGGKDLQGEINRIDSRVNQLNSRVDDVQKTAYRGIAIALAAQQAVPNIGPGQVAVFGGVGHYEGETAGSIGVVTSFTDRISASGAFGFAGGNEFGGRVGVAYVFGGK